MKKGDQAALALFGLNQTKGISINNLALSRREIKIGETLEFSFDIDNQNKKPVIIRLEYGIDYVKANGNQSRKLFKISETTIAANTTTTYSRRQSFKNLSTRKHHPGVHGLAIVVNGKEMAKTDFRLLGE